MAKKFFFLYPSLFSLTVATATLTCLPARQVKNALAKEKNNDFRLYTNQVVIMYIE